MAYTQERLAKACELFPRTASRLAFEDVSCPVYNLRKRDKHVLSSWIDDDDKDEDYTPRGRMILPKRKLVTGLDQGDRSRDRPVKRARSLPLTSMVTLRLGSHSGKALLSSIVSSLHDVQLNTWEEYRTVTDLADTSPAASRYALKVQKRTITSAGDDSDGDDNATLEFLLPAAHDLGNVGAEVPVGKPCLSCEYLDMDCSLVRKPLSYPCNNCKVDGLECELTTPPRWKRDCEKCKSRHGGPKCSYIFADCDHSLPCIYCGEPGFECIAGPAVRPPVRLMANFYNNHGNDGQLAQYDASSPVDEEDQSSVSSKTHGTDNTEDDPTTKLAVGSVPRDDVSISSGPEPTEYDPDVLHPESMVNVGETSNASGLLSVEPTEYHLDLFNPRPTVEVDKGNNISISTVSTEHHSSAFTDMEITRQYRITTYFAHPMEFLYEAPDDGTRPCHWCNNYAYGLKGLGKRCVEIADFGDGQWIELENGHQLDGKEPSRMCVECVFARIRILQCLKHKGRILPLEIVNGSVDMEAARSAILRAERHLVTPDTMIAGPSVPPPQQPWCSLCLQPATHCCGAHQDNPTPSSIGVGCGLTLCKKCLDRYMYHGTIEAVVEQNRTIPSANTETRADVDLILKGPFNLIWIKYLD
ncbi:hypothetical protein N7510_006521 [Penicillium lagena]|uniref:uncharacterized protein n=1 Tax=Penicillium lagena TaxID=94218 RepID=UPI0025415301|nr:uncharacterized protein N7510_006521 [Penicillium lagena]KAJ5613327.1 hypothetical protein N7510_006521 [Penicillium lagena]